MRKTRDLLRNIILIGVFATPLLPFVISEAFLFPLIMPKVFAFRILVEMLVVLWLALMWKDSSYAPRLSLVSGLFAAFIAAIGISNLFGIDPSRSFFGTFERMEGFVTLVHVFIYFLIAGSMMKSRKLWNRFFSLSVGVSALVATIGLLQLWGVVPPVPGTARIDALLGNPAFLGMYMLFHAFLTAYLVFLAPRGLLRLSLLGGAFLLQMFAMYFAASRGALLGLIIGAAIAAGFIVLRRAALHRALACAVLVSLAVIVVGFFSIKDSTFVTESPVLSRFAALSLENYTDGSARLFTWSIALEGFRSKPILGWGQENFNYVFDHFGMELWHTKELWFDRVHNVFLEWLVAGGFVGASLYVSILIAALYTLWFRMPEQWTYEERAIFTGLFTGYSASNFVLFDGLLSYVSFVTVLAFLHSNVSPEEDSREGVYAAVIARLSRYRFVAPVGFSILLLVFTYSFWFLNVKPILANATLVRAITIHNNDFTGHQEHFRKALEYRTFGDQEIREQLILFAVQLRNESVPDEEKEAMFRYAVEELHTALAISPESIRFRMVGARLFRVFGLHREAISLLTEAIAISPEKQYLYFALGDMYTREGEYDQAFTAFKIAFEIEPRSLGARNFYAAALIRIGEYARAEQLLEEQYGTMLVPDHAIIDAYIAREEYARVAALWRKHLESHPTDAPARFSLAGAHVLLGEREAAIAAIREAVRIDPSLQGEGEYYIQEIAAGRNP